MQELVFDGSILSQGTVLRHLRLRPTCNQRAVQIETLVAQRKELCIGMVDSLVLELKKPRELAGTAYARIYDDDPNLKIVVDPKVVEYMDVFHREQVSQRSVDWFNNDEHFRFCKWENVDHYPISQQYISTQNF